MSSKKSKSQSQKKPFQIYFISLFPNSIKACLSVGQLAKALKNKQILFKFVQLRDFAKDKHKRVDDAPFGGGEGMLIRADVLFSAWESAKKNAPLKTKTIFLSPQGKKLDQTLAQSFATEVERLILICGHYEGVDERFIEECVDLEISIGDFILTGGEIAAAALADAVCRFIPGVLGNEDSAQKDTFSNGLLKYPQYTRPREFKGRGVPEVLLSGNHQKILEWRQEQSLKRTESRRKDLFARFLKVNKSKKLVQTN